MRTDEWCLQSTMYHTSGSPLTVHNVLQLMIVRLKMFYFNIPLQYTIFTICAMWEMVALLNNKHYSLFISPLLMLHRHHLFSSSLDES